MHEPIELIKDILNKLEILVISLSPKAKYENIFTKFPIKTLTREMIINGQ